MNLKQIVEQLESCNFESVAGPLRNNVAFMELKKMAEQEAAAGTTTSDEKFIWGQSKWGEAKF